MAKKRSLKNTWLLPPSFQRAEIHCNHCVYGDSLNIHVFFQSLTSMGPRIANAFSSKTNKMQPYAIYLFFVKFCSCFRRFLRPSSRAKNCIYSFSKWTTWHTILLFYNTFITVSYMFRAASCSSSGDQIALIQHLVSSLWKFLEWRHQILY